ncbi:hypothetical protein ACTJJB_01650 [Chitinophaga sp. 22536]|uniref:hypothetical protein n=1 Tax=unclassified Chitinophaga TaxID=2619133 RepID=UPI003F867A44
MKKLLLGTFILLAFNIAVIITQMSCKKEAKADPNPTTTPGLVQQNTILLYTGDTNPANNVNPSLWLLDLDGNLKSKISPFTVPAGFKYINSKLTPDGKRIIYSVAPIDQYGAVKVFSINVDGTGAKEIFKNDYSKSAYLFLEGAY